MAPVPFVAKAAKSRRFLHASGRGDFFHELVIYLLGRPWLRLRHSSTSPTLRDIAHTFSKISISLSVDDTSHQRLRLFSTRSYQQCLDNRSRQPSLVRGHRISRRLHHVLHVRLRNHSIDKVIKAPGAVLWIHQCRSFPDCVLSGDLAPPLTKPMTKPMTKPSSHQAEPWASIGWSTVLCRTSYHSIR